MRVYIVVENYANKVVGSKTYKTFKEAKEVAASHLGVFATALAVDFESPLDAKALAQAHKAVAVKRP